MRFQSPTCRALSALRSRAAIRRRARSGRSGSSDRSIRAAASSVSSSSSNASSAGSSFTAGEAEAEIDVLSRVDFRIVDIRGRSRGVARVDGVPRASRFGHGAAEKSAEVIPARCFALASRCARKIGETRRTRPPGIRLAKEYLQPRAGTTAGTSLRFSATRAMARSETPRIDAAAKRT